MLFSKNLALLYTVVAVTMSLVLAVPYVVPSLYPREMLTLLCYRQPGLPGQEDAGRSGYNRLAREPVEFEEDGRSGYNRLAREPLEFEEDGRSGYNRLAREPIQFEEDGRSGYNRLARDNFEEDGRSGYN